MKLVIFMLLLASGVMAQTELVYTYDAAGNRIHRESLMLLQEDDSQFRNQDEEQEMIFSVFPNPATSILTINIQQYDSSIPGEITLHDAAGKVVRILPLLTPQSELDVTNLPSATYHLKITYGELSKGWMVTKLD